MSDYLIITKVDGCRTPITYVISCYNFSGAEKKAEIFLKKDFEGRKSEIKQIIKV